MEWPERERERAREREREREIDRQDRRRIGAWSAAGRRPLGVLSAAGRRPVGGRPAASQSAAPDGGRSAAGRRPVGGRSAADGRPCRLGSSHVGWAPLSCWSCGPDINIFQRVLCLVGVGGSTKINSWPWPVLGWSWRFRKLFFADGLVGEPQKIFRRKVLFLQFGCSWSLEGACSMPYMCLLKISDFIKLLRFRNIYLLFSSKSCSRIELSILLEV